MELVLTLIADPARANLDGDSVALAAQALGAAGGGCGAPDWLDPDIACDLPFTGVEAGEAAGIIGRRLAGRPFDLAIQAGDGRRKALLVADMESTIIREEMLDDLAERAGVGHQVASITAQAMEGQVPFAESLRARVALLRGADAGLVQDAASRMTLNPGAQTLVRTMRAHGAFTALVSGGFDCFARPVAERCGFDGAWANRLLWAEGRFTGTLAEPVLGPEDKLKRLQVLAEERGLKSSQTLAIGDGANDRPMVAAAGLGIAYRGKAALRAVAPVEINHGDLTAALYLQGYRRADFRT